MAAVLLLTVVLLCDVRFYRAILKRPWTAGITIAVALAIALGGQKLDNRLIAADSFRFWSPLLNPAQSRLAVWKKSEPVREDSLQQPVRELALADLIPARNVEATPEGTGVRISASPGKPQTLAAIPLPPDFLSYQNCRVRLELNMAQGAAAIGVESPDGDMHLLSAPARSLSSKGADFMPLDFNVPISDRASAAHAVQIVLRSAGETATDIMLQRALVHGCTRS